MKTYRLLPTNLDVSRIGYGCMNIGGRWDGTAPTDTDKATGVEAVLTAYENGITLFDHADIYTHGNSELVFAAVWKALPGLRDRIVLQSKCGIRFQGEPRASDPARYDFSYAHIVASVEGSLRRLQTDYLDLLLLHRPDPLVEPEEVARAFDALHASGKVRHFGVSNHTDAQIELLRRYLDHPLLVNQVELNLLHNHLIDAGIRANQVRPDAALATGLLDYCRLHDIRIQAWSPVAGGRLFNPPEAAEHHVHDTARLIKALADARQTTPEAIVLGWLLRHPAGIQPIIGTLRPERIRASCLADGVDLTREEWYALFVAARGRRVP